jgi:hypothetical protein
MDNPELRRLKGVAALIASRRGLPPMEVEGTLGVPAGSIERLVRETAAVTRMANEICRSRGDAAGGEFLARTLEQREEQSMPSEVEQRPLKVRFLGLGRDRSGTILVNATRVRLRMGSYEILEKLATTGAEGGWVRGKDLMPDGDEERARKYISQLRAELRPYVDGNPIENDKEGCYRLVKSS